MAEGEAGGAEDIVPQAREALRGQRDVSTLSQQQLAAAGKTVITASVTVDLCLPQRPGAWEGGTGLAAAPGWRGGCPLSPRQALAPHCPSAWMPTPGSQQPCRREGHTV